MLPPSLRGALWGVMVCGWGSGPGEGPPSSPRSCQGCLRKGLHHTGSCSHCRVGEKCPLGATVTLAGWKAQILEAHCPQVTKVQFKLPQSRDLVALVACSQITACAQEYLMSCNSWEKVGSQSSVLGSRFFPSIPLHFHSSTQAVFFLLNVSPFSSTITIVIPYPAFKTRLKCHRLQEAFPEHIALQLITSYRWWLCTLLTAWGTHTSLITCAVLLLCSFCHNICLYVPFVYTLHQKNLLWYCLMSLWCHRECFSLVTRLLSLAFRAYSSCLINSE